MTVSRPRDATFEIHVRCSSALSGFGLTAKTEDDSGAEAQIVLAVVQPVRNRGQKILSLRGPNGNESENSKVQSSAGGQREVILRTGTADSGGGEKPSCENLCERGELVTAKIQPRPEEVRECAPPGPHLRPNRNNHRGRLRSRIYCSCCTPTDRCRH